jgi:cell wall-associated NlpC family hydrolase
MNSKLPAIAAALALFLLLPLVGLSVALVGAFGGPLAGGCSGDGGVGGGVQQVGGQTWSAEQMTNAQTIVARAAALGLPKRAAVIAMSTGIVESRLENLGHGDLDSLGVFQQRPSQGWGPPAQILNPRTSADAFYDRLVQVPNWPRLAPGVAADLVQSSAHPERYAPQEEVAAALVDRFWQGPDNPAGTARAGSSPPPGFPAPPAAPAGPPAATGPWAVAAATVAPACPDDGESNLPAIGPLDRSALPPGFTLPTDPGQQRAVAFALAQVGKKYVFGAKGPDTFDCSGLMQAAWAAGGVGISAGTLSQIHDGVPVAGLADVAPGDLLFTPGSLGTERNPRHVGMYAGHDIVVEAHSTRTGIILQPLSVWRAKTVAIRRVGSVSAGGAAGAPVPAAAAA